MAEEWNSSFNLNSHDEEKSFSPIFFQKTPLTDVCVDKIKRIILKYINEKKFWLLFTNYYWRTGIHLFFCSKL